MHLYDFAYLSNKDDSLKVVSMMVDNGETDPQQILRQLFETFEQRYAASQIYYYLKDGSFIGNPDQAEISLFKTDFKTEGGEDIWARFVRNLRTDASQKWFGVWFVSKNSVLDFIENKFVIGNMVFSDWHNGLDFLDKLALTAIPEKWSYDTHKSKINHPVLKSYIEHMYYRLEAEGKVISNTKQIVFNTGLLNKYFKEIYIICDYDPATQGVPIYRNPSICLEGDNRFARNFDKKPPRVAFFKDISEIIFDSGLGVDTNDGHIVRDNIDRIPQKYQELYTESQLYMLFQSAVNFAARLAERNYKLIVPQYWPKTNSIQFLMPIYFSGEFAGRPDFALVLEKRPTCYQGTTILTLDMAYQNARLVAKPDDFWLNP